MINTSAEDYKKLILLDELLQRISIEEITKLLEADRIVDKLSANIPNNKTGIILQLVNSERDMSAQIVQLQSDYMKLQSYITSLVRIISKPFDNQSISEAQDLKNRLHVY
jgi:cell fate (sporulation/competence/biofilm development) regulator YlbF (YheA/YmcA/DUF963 family)